MASQGPNKTHNAAQAPDQAQVRRDGLNEPSDIHNQGQGTNFLQDTGTQVKNMAQGAAQGAVNLARGAAAGAANMTSGAADAVKNTLRMNSAGNTANRLETWAAQLFQTIQQARTIQATLVPGFEMLLVFCCFLCIVKGGGWTLPDHSVTMEV